MFFQYFANLFLRLNIHSLLFQVKSLDWPLYFFVTSWLVKIEIDFEKLPELNKIFLMKLSSFWLGLHSLFWIRCIFFNFFPDFLNKTLNRLVSNFSLNLKFKEEQEIKNIVLFLRFEVVALDISLFILFEKRLREIFHQEWPNRFFDVLRNIISSSSNIGFPFTPQVLVH